MKSAESIRNRVDELIKMGEEMRSTVRVVKDNGGNTFYSKTQYTWDSRLYASWITSCVALVDALAIAEGGLKKRTELLGKGDVTPATIDAKIGILSSLAENIDQGLLRRIEVTIGVEISYDFMGQAEALLNEDGNLKHGFVPAAVLAGAVLEKNLRVLCEQASPAIPTVKAGKGFKCMDALIDDLYQAKKVSLNFSKQLKAWAGLRNSAAHGRIGEFSKTDVERMITGVKDFVSEHLNIN
jgi:hypothetical protein